MVPQDTDETSSNPDIATGNQIALFRTEQYKEIGGSGDAFADALILLRQAGETISSSGDLGDGFGVADKGSLVGIEMLCLDWTTHEGDFGLMSICRNVTKDGRKVIIVDGSTGVHVQLQEYGADHDGKPVRHWKNGLRVSEYTYTDSSGNERPAKTYYIDTAS